MLQFSNFVFTVVLGISIHTAENILKGKTRENLDRIISDAAFEKGKVLTQIRGVVCKHHFFPVSFSL